jgi:hypothetical protein
MSPDVDEITKFKRRASWAICSISDIWETPKPTLPGTGKSEVEVRSKILVSCGFRMSTWDVPLAPGR